MYKYLNRDFGSGHLFKEFKTEIYINKTILYYNGRICSLSEGFIIVYEIPGPSAFFFVLKIFQNTFSK